MSSTTVSSAVLTLAGSLRQHTLSGRPDFLIFEPIVLSFSAWLAFLWGVMYRKLCPQSPSALLADPRYGHAVLLQSVPLVFELYGFTRAEQGLAFASLVVGASIAFCAHIHQEHLYRRDAMRARAAGLKPRPESRLYHAMVGAVLFPAGIIM